MSPLTRFRIKLVGIFTVIAFIPVVLTGFPLRFTIFVFLFCSILGVSAIIGGAIQDRWNRLRADDLLRYIARDRN